MTRTFTYLRRITAICAVLLIIFTVTVLVVRGAVWLRTSDLRTGLSGPPQVTLWDEDTSPDIGADFGGYSALIVDPNGIDFIAGSDRQHYLTGSFTRDDAGQITGTTNITRYPVRLGNITQTTRFQGDLEGLTRMSDGRIGMAFENYARVQIMDAPGAIPKGVHPWDTFEDIFGNELFEAIATLSDDTLLALFERGGTKGQTPAYRYDGTDFTGPYPFPVTDGFDVSGAERGPDGCLYILERHYGLFTGFQFQLIRMNADDWTAPRTLLYRSKPMLLGNAEGVSVWRREGALIATLITDNGFPPLQPTRVIELPLSPAPDCVGQ